MVGETVIGFADDPLLHTYAAPPLAVSVADCPDVIVTSLATEAVGPGPEETETVDTAVQPPASVTITVYVPADKPVAVAVAAAEGDQLYVYGAVPPLPVAVAVPSLPLQDAGVETTVTDGTFAEVLTETVVTTEHPSASVTITV